MTKIYGMYTINYIILFFKILNMWEPVKLDAVIDWLNTKINNEWTRYINKIENLSLKWNNLNITVTTKRSFGDYVCWFFFFILRFIVIISVPIYLISIFWLNFVSSRWEANRDVSDVETNVMKSIDLTLDSVPIFRETQVVKDYIGLMDDLLNW